MRDCSERGPDKTMIEPNEDQYQRLRRLGQKLHIPIPEAFIELEVFDKDGKLLQRHKQRSHSWTRNVYNILFSQMAAINATSWSYFGAGYISNQDTSGTSRSATINCIGQYSGGDINGTGYGYRAGSGVDSQGIVVGSGINAESFEDYKLQTQLEEGTGEGQISHTESEEHSVNYNAGTKVFKNELARYFNNNTGGDRSVNEVAIYGKIYVGGGTQYSMQCRDKLASTVTVSDTGQLKVTYTIQLTYPE